MRGSGTDGVTYGVRTRPLVISVEMCWTENSQTETVLTRISLKRVHKWVEPLSNGNLETLHQVLPLRS